MEKLRKNTCRKTISFFVTGLLTIACLPANVSVFSAAWNGTVDTSWYQADETQLSISNPEELAGLAKLVNDGTTNFEGVTITLEADLQMNPLTNWEKWETAEAQPSNTWVPIGIVNQFGLICSKKRGNRLVCRTLSNSNGKKSDHRKKLSKQL